MKLRKTRHSPPPQSTLPAISVIIPLYNAGKYIGECLDSLLIQTFQDFEVIVVDDCSTDNSPAIVESYKEKFGGRLTFTKTEKNSGGGGYVPRNIGINLASGEYIQFLDADDFLLGTALEILHTAAKQYDAEVVYTGSYYDMKTPTDIYLYRDDENKRLIEKGLEDKTILRIDDQEGNLRRFRLEEKEGNFSGPWSKFVRRDFLIENKILFPTQMKSSGDLIWVVNIYCHARRFLRISTPLYFYRRNLKSVTLTKKEPTEQISELISTFNDIVKNLKELESENRVLSENPDYCKAILGAYFRWYLWRTKEARKQLSDQEIYETLHRKFAEDASGAMVPFFFSFINAEKKIEDERLQTVKRLEKEIDQIQNFPACPAISVIIPLYNAEKYIGECLDSLLIQTFQDFEVIVVDDCSTDNSVAIVESYREKFGGRLTLAKMEENSGGGAFPRNKGLKMALGEYIQFLDADDLLLGTALETLYTVAKEYDVEVVYTSSYYDMKTPTDIYPYHDGEGKKLLKDGLENKLDLRVSNPKKNLSRLLLEEREGNLKNPWSKFIRRDFLLKNEIYFVNVPIGEDFIWVINVYCHAKRFLRLPIPLYFYRRNTGSITKTTREPSKHISYWISTFSDFAKSLGELEKANKILSENPVYCKAALDSHFRFCLYCCREEQNQLSDQEIYEALHREFLKDSSASTVPFFFSYIDKERKINEEQSQTIKKLEKKLAQVKISSNYLAVSVIIALYNAEKYIGECLDSLLAQTFQNFEVIVVDDCSTDNSVKIVEEYIPKFDDRLILAKTKKNSSGGGLPRNKGVSLSRGEYIQFLDADDMLTKTALEEMYTLAKDYNADVVNCEKFYFVDDDGTNIRAKSYQEGKFVSKPTFESEDLKKRVQNIIDDRYLTTTCNKFVRRDLITENEIFFPSLKTSEDNIWTQGLIFYGKKFLRVPNVVYIYRQSEGSSQRTKRTAQQNINFWLNPVLLGLKALDNLMSRHDFFKTNPSLRFALLKKFIDRRFSFTKISAQKLSDHVIFTAIKEVFCDKLGDYDVLIPALCTALYNEKKGDKLLVNKDFLPYITGRLDIQLTAEKEGSDFKILSVSDDNAKIKKSTWLTGNEIGYFVQSHVGKLSIIAKATVEGKIGLKLKAMDIRDPKDRSKRVPYWIDYTSLKINDQKVFDELKPTWHDKPYRYTFDVKAGEEIKIQTEWLPHRGDNKVATTKKAKEIKPLVNKDFLPYITGRLDIQLTAEKEGGDFKIVSVSDDDAKIKDSTWLTGNEIGYFIQSCAGKLEIIVKATVEGKIDLKLKAMDIRDPQDRSKRVPYWIDYTGLTVNGKKIFDELKPTWHDKPYRYTFDVKAGEEIHVQTEWLPHRGDNQTATTKKAVDIESLVNKDFLPYITGRLDIQLTAEKEGGDFKIVSVSDDDAKIKDSTWLTGNEMGYFIQSCAGKLEIIVKATVEGKIDLKLKAMDIRDPQDRSKRVPYWIDYTGLTVNGKKIFDELKPTWHDKPYRYTFDVEAGEEIKIQTEWLPHRGDLNY